MKVLMLNGSSRLNGCTYTALSVVAEALEKNGIESEIVQMGAHPVRDCCSCGGCKGTGKCVFGDDIVNRFIDKAAEADGFVFGSPVYYAHPSGQVLAALDRIFYAGGANFRRKPAAAVVSARRAGTTCSFDVLNKYFSISEMPVVSSSYWNMVHGNTPEEVMRDLEGLQVMRTLGNNMAYILKCLRAGKEAGVLPPAQEEKIKTNFIR